MNVVLSDDAQRCWVEREMDEKTERDDVLLQKETDDGAPIYRYENLSAQGKHPCEGMWRG